MSVADVTVQMLACCEKKLVHACCRHRKKFAEADKEINTNKLLATQITRNFGTHAPCGSASRHKTMGMYNKSSHRTSYMLL